MSKLAEKLCSRLNKEFGIDNLIPKIYRTRAGYWQRSRGAWRQYVFSPAFETIWNKDCLKDIQDFLQQLMDERKS